MTKTRYALVLKALGRQINGAPAWEVTRGKTWLALVTFDGPRNTIVTHQGALYADERKEVYRIQRDWPEVITGQEAK